MARDTKPPSLSLARCRWEDCEFDTLSFSMTRLMQRLKDHMMEEHGWSEEKWERKKRELYNQEVRT